MERKTNIPKMAEEQLRIIQGMQKQIDDIQKLSNSNIVATMGVIEKMEPMLGSISSFNEYIKPIIDRQSEIKDTILASSIPTSALHELAIRQDILKSITAGNVYNLKSNLDVMRKNQTLLEEVAAASSSMYAKLDNIEKRHFEELDKLQPEEDIKELEEIVGTDDVRNKTPLSFLICVFFMILIFVSSGGVQKLEDNQDESTDKNPLYAIAESVGIGVLSSWISNNLCKGLTKVSCYIKNGFSKKSKKVFKIDVNQEIYIIGEERYYYNIIYHNEMGELKEGYIPKRNVRKIENLK
ncbi:MAG: hypothetical protein E6315_01035 [Peptoniphilus harei]|nr:hypothetical protein [Peptoniphilus harei]